MTRKKTRWQLDRLGPRLVILMAAALFPLLVLALVQSQTMQKTRQARSEAALMGETLRVVSDDTRLLQETEAQVRLLAAIVLPVIDHTPICNSLMRKARDLSPKVALVGYVPLNGQMTCSSDGRAFDLSQNPDFQDLAQKDGVGYAVAMKGHVTKKSALAISYPVFDQNGTRVGFVYLSLPHTELKTLDNGTRMSPMDRDRPLAIMTFDTTGQVLTASAGLDDIQNHLPAGTTLAALAKAGNATFSAKSQTEEDRVYSVTTLIPGQLFALGSWPGDAQFAAGDERYSPIILPALMWIGSLIVVYLAMQYLVIGHIRRLSTALADFASGKRIVATLDFPTAPREIQELAQSYEAMTETILYDEANLEDVIHHKEVLLRELHHRVKNNLQLIASIINMQLRRSRSPEARTMMKALQDRIISLSTVHRGLYMTSGLTDIDARELISDIVSQLMKATNGPEHHIVATTDLSPIRLTPDQAVPLSLLLTEAMTNAIKYAASDTGTPRLWVTLRQLEDGMAELEVRNTVSSVAPQLIPEEAQPNSGLGSQLVSAFVLQLGGQLKVDTLPEYHIMRVQFRIRPLTEAEWRHEEAVGGGRRL